MTCIYDVLEEYDERSDGAGLVGTHESRGIEKGKEQECRRYGQREMWKQQQKEMVRRVVIYRGSKFSIQQLLLGGGWPARRLECFRMLGGDATLGSEGKSCTEI